MKHARVPQTGVYIYQLGYLGWVGMQYTPRRCVLENLVSRFAGTYSTTPDTNTARFLEMGVFDPANAPGLRLVGKVG